MQRLETALLEASAAAAGGSLHWASLASASGFSDQPHLGRECRRLSGTSPADLIDRQARDESCSAAGSNLAGRTSSDRPVAPRQLLAQPRLDARQCRLHAGQVVGQRRQTGRWLAAPIGRQ